MSYDAVIKRIADLSSKERNAMVELYLSYYDNADEEIFFSDLEEKNEVDLLFDDDKLVGFSTILFYDFFWREGTRRIVYSGDTIVDEKHWGQQVLHVAWIERMARLAARNKELPLYWFLLVKGHRTYKFLPTFARSFYPSWKEGREDLKGLADALATAKFGSNYNSSSGVIEFERSMGNLKERIAYPSSGERKQASVKFFLEKNPGYLRGHELVCLCEISCDNLKPFARRIFERGYR